MRMIPIDEQFNGARLRIEQLEQENEDLRRALKKVLKLYKTRIEAERILRKLEVIK